ncbi:MAG: alkaline phosphatase [Flavobacteriaceae bacterium]
MKFLFLFTFFFSSVIGFSQQNSPNIILMIGDGMGLTQISSGMYANGNQTSLEECSFIGLSKTAAANRLVTDSAASGTAMACGVKTYNGVLGLDTKNTPHKSILEFCKEKGYTTALLATSSILHATPASFYAKVTSRREYETIAFQLSQHQVDYFVGGGKKFFIDRKDKRNLINEMTKYTFVETLEEYEASSGPKIGFLTYDEEPPSLMEGRVPSLNELTVLTLEKLKATEKPFFMMVEGSQIDWGGHDNNLDYVVSEFKEFDTTIRKVLEFAKEEGNTLVIITADHETGGLALTNGDIDKGKVKGSFNTEGHSATMVPVFSFGKHAALFSGIYENTEIFHKMHAALTKE